MCKPGGGSKGTNTNTVVQQSGPPPQILANYEDAYNRAVTAVNSNAGAQPYPGNIVAPFNATQAAAFNQPGLGSAMWAPYTNAAQDFYGQATQPIWSPGIAGAFGQATVPSYTSGVANAFAPASAPLGPDTQANLSPYIQSVINATQAQFNNQNAIQQNQVIGNAGAQGAWGGDRSAVAQGIVAGQQQMAQAPVIAGLYNQGYQQAQQATLQQRGQQLTAAEARLQAEEAQRQQAATAAQGQLGAEEANRWLASQAAAGYGNLGQQAFGIGQGTLSSELQLGGLEQAQRQAELNVPYQQYIQAQAYPYQTAGWLANIAGGLGGLSGGTSTTTTPGASFGSQVLGAGIGGVGLLGATGGFGANGWLTGNSGLLSGIGGMFGGGTGSAAALAGGIAVPAAFADTAGGLGADALLAAPFFRRGGSIPRRESGGIAGVYPQFMPPSTEIPNVAVSVFPQKGIAPPMGGMGPPKPPQGMPIGAGGSGLDLPSVIKDIGTLKQAGIFGSPNSAMRRGGGILGYDAGGDTMDLPDVDVRATPLQSTGITPSAVIPSTMDGIAPSEPAFRPNPWMALAAAGFGMAAGRSPQALQNIGAGALEGVKFYEQERQVAPRLELEQAEAQKARTEAAYLTAGINWSMTHDLGNLNSNVADATKAHTAATAVSPASASMQAGQNLGEAERGFNALLPIETNGDPNAVSPKGAIGLAQIVPATAKQYVGRDVSVAELKDPKFNLPLGQKIYADLLGKYGGDHDVAWAAYNAGPAVADKYVASGKDPSALPKETQNYIRAARNNYQSIGAQAGAASPTLVQLPGGSVVPSGGGGGPQLEDFDRTYQYLDNMKRMIGAPGYPVPPQAKMQQMIQIEQMLMQRKLADPRMQALQEQMKTQAQKRVALQYDPLIAGASTAAKEAQTWHTLRPGSVGGFGSNLNLSSSTIQHWTDAGGKEHPYYAATPGPGQPPPPGMEPPNVPGGPIAAPQPGSQPGSQPGTPGQAPPITSKLGPGDIKHLTEHADVEEEQAKATVASSDAARYQQASLFRMREDADNIFMGPFSSHVQDAMSFLRFIDPRFNKPVASYEDLMKNSVGLTRQATHDTSPRASFQEVQFIQGSIPTPAMSPQGFRSVTDEYIGLNDYRMAKATAQNNWRQAHGGNVAGFEDDWQAHPPVTPYAYIIQRMEPAERQDLFAKWNKTYEGRAVLQSLHKQMLNIANMGLEPQQ